MDVPATLGVVGVGTIGSAVVRGLCLPGPETPPSGLQAVVLSPRGAVKAEALRTEFPNIVRIAGTNSDVVQEADCILVSVLPKQAEAVLQELPFRREQQVISLVAGLSVQRLRDLCAPAGTVSIAIPFPSIAKQRGAALLLQPGPAATGIFRRLGRHVAVESEEHFRRLMCISGLMGNFYKQQLTAQEWLEQGGVPAEAAAAWTSAAFNAFAADSVGAGPRTFADLLAEQTPGGLNEKVWQLMEDNKTFSNRLCPPTEHEESRFNLLLVPDLSTRSERMMGTTRPCATLWMPFTTGLGMAPSSQRWRQRRGGTARGRPKEAPSMIKGSCYGSSKAGLDFG